MVLVIALIPVFGGGKQEQDSSPREPSEENKEIQQEEASGAGAEVSPQAESSEPEYTESQEKLASIGFQLPIEPFKAPEFSLSTLEGEEVSLSDLRGKVIFLNFWATWCGPCKAEMPSMETLYKSMPKDKFAILAVNVNEPKGTVSDFISQNGYSFPVLLDETGEVGGMYQVQGIPTTWIIDSEMNVLGRLVGTTEWDTPEKIDIFEFLIASN